MKISVQTGRCTADIELTRATVLYGPNGTCKTSVARAVYATLKVYSGDKAVKHLPDTVSAVIDDVRVLVGNGVAKSSAYQTGISAAYLPSGRVVYIDIYRRLSLPDIGMQLPGQFSALADLFGDYIKVILSTYSRLFFEIDAEYMFKDIMNLNLDITALRDTSHSALNFKLILNVIRSMPHGSVLLVDDLDAYMDDNYVETVGEIVSALEENNVYMLSTVRRLDVAKSLASAVDGSRIYEMRAINTGFATFPI